MLDERDNVSPHTVVTDRPVRHPAMLPSYEVTDLGTVRGGFMLSENVNVREGYVPPAAFLEPDPTHLHVIPAMAVQNGDVLFVSNGKVSSKITNVGGNKLDKGKPPMDMLDFVALAEIAKVLQFGAKKYAADNWREGITTRRTVAAALRHLLQYVSGEKLDAETGLSHLAHAGCEIMFALNAQQTRPDLDDCYVAPNH